jgi:argininosuccinate lyase
VDLPDVSDEELSSIDARLTPDVREVLSVSGALAARSAIGGTSPRRVAEQLATLTELVHSQADWAAG